MRSIPISLAALLLGATLAFATPQVRVQSLDGIARIELTGSYPQSRYTVFRSPATGGTWAPLTGFDVLCLGACLVEDPSARAGETYRYRFDFQLQDGSRASFGPYAVTIPASLARTVGARVVPNPSRGPAGIEIHLAPAAGIDAVRAEVRIFDLQGRVLRTLHDGELPRGISRIEWDGRDAAGRMTLAGTYFVTVRSPLGETRPRLTRIR